MFWLRNKKNNFHLHTLIWWPEDNCILKELAYIWLAQRFWVSWGMMTSKKHKMSSHMRLCYILYSNVLSNITSSKYNKTSNWIMSLICESISCDILSQTRPHYVTSFFIVDKWISVLCGWKPLDVGATKYIFTVFLKEKY